MSEDDLNHKNGHQGTEGARHEPGDLQGWVTPLRLFWLLYGLLFIALFSAFFIVPDFQDDDVFYLPVFLWSTGLLRLTEGIGLIFVGYSLFYVWRTRSWVIFTIGASLFMCALCSSLSMITLMLGFAEKPVHKETYYRDDVTYHHACESMKRGWPGLDGGGYWWKNCALYECDDDRGWFCHVIERQECPLPEEDSDDPECEFENLPDADD